MIVIHFNGQLYVPCCFFYWFQCIRVPHWPLFRAQKLLNSVFLVKNDGSRSVICISNKFSGGLCTTRVFYMSVLPGISLDKFLDEFTEASGLIVWRVLFMLLFLANQIRRAGTVMTLGLLQMFWRSRKDKRTTHKHHNRWDICRLAGDVR